MLGAGTPTFDVRAHDRLRRVLAGYHGRMRGSLVDGTLAHLVFEMLAYTVGAQLFVRARKRHAPLAEPTQALSVAAGAIFGAASGAKILFWLQFPTFAFASFPDPARLLAGKTIVGGLLGGVAGVEIAKRLVGVRRSTGDAFVAPLLVGMVLGRLGCFAAGLDDATYGARTARPWGVDFGDGVARHPTQLYEIAFLVALGLTLHRWRDRLPASGDAFRAFMVAYLAFRWLVDGLKPPHGAPAGVDLTAPSPQLYGPWTAIQVSCLLGLAYFAWDLRRTREPRARVL